MRCLHMFPSREALVKALVKLSLATQSAQANLQASQSDLAAVKLSVHSTVAQTYFSVQATEAHKELLERTVLV